MTPIVAAGNPLTPLELKAFLDQVLESILKDSPKSILFIPPDFSRLNSQAGYLTAYLHQHLPPGIKKAVLPATGLHRPMTPEEQRIMFTDAFQEMEFHPHRSRDEGNHRWGKISNEELRPIFGNTQETWEGLWDDIEVITHRKILEYDLVLSLGQVLPHEITGMSNYHKNILIGVGGDDFINKSHFMGAVIGIPQLVGRADNPIRDFLKTTYDRFIRPRLNIRYLFSVIHSTPSPSDVTYGSEKNIAGLYYGNDDELFRLACRKSEEVNITQVSPLCDRVWVHMPPHKYTSLWLANKAIYRTLGIIREGGELIVDAPGVKRCGESQVMDEIISTHGYTSAQVVLEKLAKELTDPNPVLPTLLNQLGVAAHLIHGYPGNHRVLFVDHSREGGLKPDDYRRVGFDSLSPEQFQKDLATRFPTVSLQELYAQGKPSSSLSGSHEYFINDAGMGFWKSGS